MSTAANRETFVKNILATYSQYNLDGIDIDWEYPGQAGNQGNTESPSDEENMVEFLKLLRLRLPPNAKISAAVQDTPFAGRDGQPIKDTSEFAKCVDWILIMNYDTFQGLSAFETKYWKTLMRSSCNPPWSERAPVRWVWKLESAIPERSSRVQRLDINRIPREQNRSWHPRVRLRD